MLFHEIPEAFRKGNLELWCPKMIIRKQGGEQSNEKMGSGIIRQDDKKQIKFILLERSPSSLSDIIKKKIGEIFEVGKIIPGDKYYSLEAIDISGNTWKADRFLISQSIGPEGSIIRGNIYVLEQKKPYKFVNDFISLEIFHDVNLPLILDSKELKKMANGEEYINRKIAIINVCETEFKIMNENGILTISAEAEKRELPENIETRIIEALQFVTSKTISWGILQKGNSITNFRSSDRESYPTNISMPIDFEHADRDGKWCWRLFGKYIEHIYKFKGENSFEMHPLSAWLNFIRNTSVGSIFTKGLGLGIAVEGILKCEYSKNNAKCNENIDDFEKMINHVKSFEGSENIRIRTIGAINYMKQIRAKDRLYALKEEGVVREEDVKAWDNIRNRGAHARPPEGEEMQVWIDSCYKTKVLINHLIFNAIGYKGKYTDYGNRTDSWPTRVYPLSGNVEAILKS